MQGYDARVIALIVFLIGASISLLIRLAFKSVFGKIVKKTESELDNKLLERLLPPLFWLLIVCSAGFAYYHTGIFSEGSFFVEAMLKILAALLTSFLIIRAATVMLHKATRTGDEDTTPRLLDFLVTLVVLSIAMIMILAHFKVEITPLLTTLGVGGLAVGLALKDMLENLFAGLYILSTHPIKIGDYIEMEDGKVKGYVKDINWRQTRIKTPLKETIIVPNNRITNTVITNVYQPRKHMRFSVDVGVAPEMDLEKVEKITMKVANKVQKKSESAVTAADPLIRFHTFGESNIIFSVLLVAKSWPLHHKVRHDFIKELKAEYDKKKIEMAPPTRKVFLKQVGKRK